MNNISVFEETNENGFKYIYVKIERSYLEKMKGCLGTSFEAKEISQKLKENEETYIIYEINDFHKIIEELMFRADLHCDLDFFKTISGQFLEQYTTAFDNYTTLRGEVDKNHTANDFSIDSLVSSAIEKMIFENDFDAINSLIEYTESLILISKKIYKQRDLNNAKEIVLDSLKYIVSLEDVIKYQQKYESMLQEVPIDLDKIEQYLIELQQIILKDWKNGITSINDYKAGSKFKFIGHSTNSDEIEGEFRSSFISCSLLTEEFTDTFHMGFGFLFSPENIVGADARDMYVNNYAIEEENMLITTTLHKISSIARILEQCRIDREENKRNGVDEKVYSEVVIKGFKPIGIFCFMVGEKSLSRHYQAAKKLQAQYPELPIVEIDLTLYKEKEDLISYRDRLIQEIESNITPNAIKQSAHYYDLYEYFWQNYLKLKQSDDYCEGDIISLYRENNELISTPITKDKLSSGVYNAESLRWSILHNSLYGLNMILKGKFSSYDLKKLSYGLIEFVDNELLNQAIPGLVELIKIISFIDITQINVELICQKQPVTIENISEILRLEIDKSVIDIKEDISLLEKRKIALINSKEQKEEQLKENREYGSIIECEYIYSLAHSDYVEAELKLSKVIEAKELVYIDCEKSDNQIKSLTERHGLLSKHKIINFFKLRKLKNMLKTLEISRKTIRERLDKHERYVESLQLTLDDIERSFKEMTSIDFSDYAVKLSLAKQLYTPELDSILVNDISDIQNEIDLIEQKIISLNSKYQQLEEVSSYKK